ncbi:hypothetical protein [Paenibacillus amylolyticus]|uniref:hypothetical protein n=1 Tax=Paenibacillus amylolyticus TaxID=1451 RepID=UPI0039B0651D
MEDKYSRLIEETFKINAVLVVGSGTSADAGISGMRKLATYLTEHVDTLCIRDHLKQTCPCT